MKITNLRFGAAVACTLFASVASANLVYNGSFEIVGQSNYNFVVNDPTTLAGWSLASGAEANANDCVVLAGSGPDHQCGTTAQQTNPIYNLWVAPGASPDGGNYFLMDGDPTPATQTQLYQMITTTPGDTYQLSFYQATGQFQPLNGATTERWQVQFGDQTVLSDIQDTASHGSDGWELESFTFVADSTSTLLGFLAVGTPTSDPPLSFLDGVSLTDDGVVTPEPSTIALTFLGLMGLPAARRLLRKKR